MAKLRDLPNVMPLALDVIKLTDIRAAVEAVSKETGGTLDYLISNAGRNHFFKLLCPPHGEVMGRSGKYYKSWGPTTPIVIVSTKKKIAELSEAPCLSQRAVYADMLGFKHTMDKLEHNTNKNRLWMKSFPPHSCVIPRICVIHAVLTNRGEAMHLIQEKLSQCIESGLSNQTKADRIQSHTILYNIITLTSGSGYWNPDLISQSLLGIWFAASYQPWMNLHFVNIRIMRTQGMAKQTTPRARAIRPARLQRLRTVAPFGWIHQGNFAIRRKALEPYTFSDGSLSVPSGATVCVSAYDLMHNPQTYPDPTSFNPSRFLPKESNGQQRKFTEVSEIYPIWGYGSLDCPGRFHPSLAMKIVISQLLLKYDLSLENENSRTRWSWETFAMPYKNTRVILKGRGLGTTQLV
ncbi:cytochrome P450 [Daldinia grandis]|nr:cytochrome P450 [Daldinia grandis]